MRLTYETGVYERLLLSCSVCVEEEGWRAFEFVLRKRGREEEGLEGVREGVLVKGNRQARTKNVAPSARGAAFSEIHWALSGIKRCGAGGARLEIDRIMQ